MLQLTLGDKKHTLPFITARALREIGQIERIYEKSLENESLTPQDMDAAIDWLCILFDHRFTPDDVLDKYPSSTFWYDIFIMFLSVKNQFEDKLMSFPTQPEPKTPENPS